MLLIREIEETVRISTVDVIGYCKRSCYCRRQWRCTKTLRPIWTVCRKIFNLGTCRILPVEAEIVAVEAEIVAVEALVRISWRNCKNIMNFLKEGSPSAIRTMLSAIRTMVPSANNGAQRLTMTRNKSRNSCYPSN